MLLGSSWEMGFTFIREGLLSQAGCGDEPPPGLDALWLVAGSTCIKQVLVGFK